VEFKPGVLANFNFCWPGDLLRLGQPRSEMIPNLQDSDDCPQISAMPPHPPRDPSGPPHNPELRELVAGKRKWSVATPQELGRQGFNGWHERGYLPHRDQG
jgi:hypothetical protein